MPHTKLMQATDKFYESLVKLLHGDAEPMFEVWSHKEDITYMGPVGGLLVGWQKIKESWTLQAKSITKGQVQPKNLHFYESDGLGVVVGYEDSVVTVDGKLVQIKLRATSIFRMENGAFKMIAHHTDLF